MAEQLFAVNVSHARAEARVSVAKLPVHAVQGVGHGVHSVHHKLDLPFLLVAGVEAHFFQSCRRNSERSEKSEGNQESKGKVKRLKQNIWSQVGQQTVTGRNV